MVRARAGQLNLIPIATTGQQLGGIVESVGPRYHAQGQGAQRRSGSPAHGDLDHVPQVPGRPK